MKFFLILGSSEVAKSGFAVAIRIRNRAQITGFVTYVCRKKTLFRIRPDLAFCLEQQNVYKDFKNYPIQLIFLQFFLVKTHIKFS